MRKLILVKRDDNGPFVGCRRLSLSSTALRLRDVKVIVRASQNGVGIQVQSFAISLFCKPSIPNTACDDPTDQESGAMVDAAAFTIKRGDLEQSG